MRRLLFTICTVVALALTAPTAQAQETGQVYGTITDATTGEPLPGANVEVQGFSIGAAAEVNGSYRIEEVPAGIRTLRISYVGYENTLVELTIPAGASVRQDVALEEESFVGNEVVVTASKQAEKVLDSPVTIEAISAEDLNVSGGGTFLSSLKNLKGIDFVSVGINGQGISARGFTNHFNTRMLSMVDGRVAQLPGTGLPQGNFLPTAPLDVKSMEVVVGPASALYGPNAHTGVVNVITKDPWDESGVALALRGGQNSLMDGTARIAGTFGDRFGWKVTGQYLKAEDFQPFIGGPTVDCDPNAGVPCDLGQTGPFDFDSGFNESQLVENYDIMSAKFEGNAYYRFDALGDEWTLKGTYGWSENDNFGLTNNGRNRILGWQVQYQTAQLSSENWYAQFTRTANDAGDTYQINGVATAVAGEVAGGKSFEEVDLAALRATNGFTDKGELLDSELQYRTELAGFNIVTGGQWRKYSPDSEGTFLADAAGQDIGATEVGGYMQLDRRFLDQRLRLNAAARVDNHSDYGTQFSPKAAVVATVAKGHNVRVGYNRAFKSPTVLESNLLISIAGAPIFQGNIDGYTIRSGATSDAPVVAEIAPLEPEEVNSVELGYKGILGKRVFVDVVAYNSWYTNFISPLTNVADPLGILGGPSRYAFDDSGTLVADGTAFGGTLSTYTNFGEATVRGLDAGVDVYVSDHITLNGSVSLIGLADFTAEEGQTELLLNVPTTKFKGSVTVRDFGLQGAFVNVAGRWQNAYEFRSGYWDSRKFYADGEIPSRFVMDLTAGYEVAQTGLELKASVTNVLDNTDVDVLGSPERGRFVWVMASYGFDGLRF